MRQLSRLVLGAVLAWLALAPASVHANSASLGPHLGINLDIDDAFLGIEGRFDVAHATPSVAVQVNPSFSYYFTDNADLFNVSFNIPFEFAIDGSSLRPFAAPGLGIWHWEGAGDRDDTDITFNILGGLLFELGVVEPFVQLRIVIGDGSAVELMGGVLFGL